MIRIRLPRILSTLRRDFMTDVEKLVAGEPVRFDYPPLVLAFMTKTARMKRAELRIKKMRKEFQ